MAKQSDTDEKRILSWTANVTIVGFIIGPLVGSGLYSCLGSMHTFFIFGSFLVFLSVIIKMNFNGDATDAWLESDCDDSYRGDNQFRYADELSSFRNDVTPERIYEQDYELTNTEAGSN